MAGVYLLWRLIHEVPEASLAISPEVSLDVASPDSASPDAASPDAASPDAASPDAAGEADTAAVTARLESALDRIAALAARPATRGTAPGPDTTAVAGRLDALIADLTAELAGDSHS